MPILGIGFLLKVHNIWMEKEILSSQEMIVEMIFLNWLS